MKELKAKCEHIDGRNQLDCENDAEYMCMCCSVPLCAEHTGDICPFGGMGFIELD